MMLKNCQQREAPAHSKKQAVSRSTVVLPELKQGKKKVIHGCARISGEDKCKDKRKTEK